MLFHIDVFLLTDPKLPCPGRRMDWLKIFALRSSVFLRALLDLFVYGLIRVLTGIFVLFAWSLLAFPVGRIVIWPRLGLWFLFVFHDSQF
jgi:hypothetical protein